MLFSSHLTSKIRKQAYYVQYIRIYKDEKDKLFSLTKKYKYVGYTQSSYVGHLLLRTNIIYVDVIIWTSLNELAKMRNLVYSENLNNVLSENSLKTKKM